MIDIPLGDRVAERIKQTAKNKGVDALHFLRSVAIERLVARIGAVDEEERACLKGGMLWWLQPDLRGDARPTADADVHFHETIAPAEVEDLLRRAMALEAGDGMSLEMVYIGDLKHSGDHPGLRAKFVASFGKTRVHFHADVGFGGRKDPAMARVSFEGSVTGMPGGSIPMVPLATVYAEKLHAVVNFGADNTRLKDLHDLVCIARRGFDPARFAEAVERTFEDRGTPVPVTAALLPGLSPEFAAARQQQWGGFLRDAARTFAMAADLAAVTKEIAFHASNVFQKAHALRGPAAGYRPAA